ncbi:glycoside hydrolase family 2 TIM barrel-domain containing protein [uncultured Maribacter sp.]|uniref:glycoside hydrolase family 2 TIM barrel-domain containing protein n=1 Tax=uncultured Maribacter sp. TaxID=431308 RepID=UPI002622E68C|nr:glycoside hydrolase family 2 TIM barrel-domain containing protein [uncultured Maribacter sp.]
MNFSRIYHITLTFTLLFLLASCSRKTETEDFIKDLSFNKDWLFSKGDMQGNKISIDDTNWLKLNLPHDWAIEGPFDKKYNARTGGLPVHGEAWYRKHFTIDKKLKGKQISVEFDGAMNNAKVWVNDEYIGERPYGYIGFEFDITKNINYGEDNVISVQLTPEDLAARWYSGAGIYRNVRLKINNPIYIPQYGTYITTPEVSSENAQVNIKTSIKNTSEDATVSLKTEIKDNKGNIIAINNKNVSVSNHTDKTEDIILNVENPKLWSIDSPILYTAITSIIKDNTTIDQYETTFGIRTIEFDKEKGFLLNNKPVELNGVCMHHDQGALGTAINFRAKQRQMEIMQSMGVNALRTSHNPPSPEILKACDELGIVVIVEAFDEWKMGKVPNGYSKYFDKWHEKDLRDMIKRDRNHPSVIMWSIGNEILEQSKKDGWKLTKHLNDICHDEDNTRPTTAGFNYFPAPFTNKLAQQIDIVGMNYWPENYGEILEENPNMIIYGSETSSMTSSRGVYHLPITYKEKHETNHVSSYDAIVGPSWAYLPDAEFDAQAKEPKSLGEFIWTGFDYLGEPTPYGGRDNSTNGYWNDDWPSKSSYFAPVDLCGFPKDRYYLYQSQWTKEPMVHVLPHWNWKGMENKKIPVFAYTNGDEAELFVNGKSYGKKIKGKDLTEIPAEYHGFEKGMYKSKYRLSWNVPYTEGELKVIAYEKGRKVATDIVKTAGAPNKINLKADRQKITANGEDLSFITVSITDKDGNLCPRANNLVEFKVTGEGSIAAVGNGDQTSLASFQANNRKAFNGLCLLVIKSNENSGKIHIEATSKGLNLAKITITSEK